MKAKYQNYTSKEDYERAGLKWVVPMTAKEITDEEEQKQCLRSADFIVEEKFDGTRATMHFIKNGARIFSRRVSEKTGWFCENSDSVPHLRDLSIPELKGTVIDGEMFIPNRPFKDVSSTLNCTWDKAIQRQEELGKVVLHAFDIVFYKGLYVAHLNLLQRKRLLHLVIESIKSPYIEEVMYFNCADKVVLDGEQKSFSAWDYYQHIVKHGGEGVMLKPITGIYEHKRSKAYLKIKKFLTKEVVILAFDKPTKEYKGKFPNFKDWEYWENESGCLIHNSAKVSLNDIKSGKIYPVSKFYFKHQVGNIIFGVVFEENDKLTPKLKKQGEFIEHEGKKYLVVGECSGFDEEQRMQFSKNPEKYLFTTIEVKANEIFKDTGKLRHPRFLRCRFDKNPEDCTWKNHIE